MSATLVLTHTQETDTLQQEAKQNEEEEKAPREAELFIFDNCSKGLGLKICGGCSLDGEELYGIFVKRVLPGGLADQDGGLQGGDQLLEVNGESLEGVTNDRAVSILRQASASNHVEMVVVRDGQARAEFREIMEKNSGSSFPCTPVPTDPKQSEIVCKKLSVSSGSGQEMGESKQSASQEEESAVTPQEPIHGSEILPGPVLNGGMTPKHQWRGLLPSMASTPDQRGASTKTVSSDSQFSSLPQVEPSPVGYPPILSLNNMTEMSDGSVFHPGSVSQPQHHRQDSLTRKLSLDPHERVKVNKLNSALRYLGIEPTVEQEAEMMSKLRIDPVGTVNYGGFVCFVLYWAKISGERLQDHWSSGSEFIEACDLKVGRYRQLIDFMKVNGGASGVSLPQLQQDNEDLRQENIRLEMLLREKEEEVLRIRKQAQGAIHEQRELRSKVHLAAEAQKAARDMETDYEEVVHLLEGEIAQLKIQLTQKGVEDPVMQKRLAVLTCQLRKAEQEKETFKVATERLLQFAETVHESLSDTNGPAPSRPLTSGEGAKPRLLGKLKRPAQTASRSVAAEAKEVAASVRNMIDTQPLPFGWEETYTEDGMKYYINHLNQVTTWSHPLSGITHLPATKQEKTPEDGIQPGTSQDR